MQNVCRPSACSHLGIVRHEGAGDLARRMPSHITRAIVLSTGRSDKPCEPDLYCYERLGSCPPGRVCLATALLTCQIAPSLSLSDKAAMLLTQNAAASPQQGATAGKLTIALLLPMCTAVFFCGFALGHWHASSYDVGSVGKLPGLRFRSSAGFRRGLDKDVNRFVGHASRRESFRAVIVETYDIAAYGCGVSLRRQRKGEVASPALLTAANCCYYRCRPTHRRTKTLLCCSFHCNWGGSWNLCGRGPAARHHLECRRRQAGEHRNLFARAVGYAAGDP